MSALSHTTLGGRVRKAASSSSGGEDHVERDQEPALVALVRSVPAVWSTDARVRKAPKAIDGMTHRLTASLSKHLVECLFYAPLGLACSNW
jgi:hypothetical protein